MLSQRFIKLLVFIVLLMITNLSSIIVSSENVFFDFPLFSPRNLTLLGDSYLRNGVIGLTRELGVPSSSSGTVIYNNPIAFIDPETNSTASFSTRFCFSINNVNPSSFGDGLAFFLSPDNQTLGSPGGFLGLVNSSQLTKNNSNNFKPEIPLLTVPIDLSLNFKEFMYVGFAASTEGSTEIHLVQNWSFQTSGLVHVRPTSKQPHNVSNSVNVEPHNMPVSSPTGKHHKKIGLAFGIAGPAFFCVALAVFGYISVKKWRRVRIQKGLKAELVAGPREFSYKELHTATRGFHPSRIIGHGAFGEVYKAFFVSTGTIAAVKRSKHSHEGKTEFLAEMSIIACLRHKNLVQLQGWCAEKDEILLVYEFMPYGSLDKMLYQEADNGTFLNWAHRHNIAVGLASYGKATDKTDMFSYGVVILEVACGRRPIEREPEGQKMVNLVDWVWGLYGEGRILEAADKRLCGGFSEEDMKKLLLIGLSCANPDSEVRPTMRRVLQILNNEAEAIVVPKSKPSLMFSAGLSLAIEDIVSDYEEC
ncbi:hypothetical protein ACFE04_004725 [Oxalis oulophora]